jgi:uncharacterized protein (DUF302 family)
MVKVLTLLLFSSFSLAIDSFNVVRVNTNFNNTWQALNDKVDEYNYKTAYLQRCDFALNERDYKSDKYRILFFGEYKKMEYLSRKYSAIVPYLPLKVVVMAEGDNTIIINNPLQILLPTLEDKDKEIINKWQQDLDKIFAEIKTEYE